MPLAQWAVARAYRRKLWYRFQQEGIEIPYPQRTLWLKSVSEESAGPIASMLPQSADPQMAKANPQLSPENKPA